MKIGFIGLGKLGKPVALGMCMRGHDVVGYDTNPSQMTRTIATQEDGFDDKTFDELLTGCSLRFGSMQEVVDHAQIVFVAVETPHSPLFDGTMPLSQDRKDFDYTRLVECVRQLNFCIKKETIVVVISTVLPGTMRRFIIPILNPMIRLVYNPYFIAMGTVLRDFFRPEFVLVGSECESVIDTIKSFYLSIHDRPTISMSIESAELTKVAYNTFIGMKIGFANCLMEICHKIPGANVDDVTNALGQADVRLISKAYLRAGMGDGGSCHPRDHIAMSYMARSLALSHDIFSDLMQAREDQAAWLVREMDLYALPKVILGKTFKPKTNITAGSPALLCSNILSSRRQQHVIHDPTIDPPMTFTDPSVFLIATRHECFTSFKFPSGSVVLDPHGFIPKSRDCKVIWIGREILS